MGKDNWLAEAVDAEEIADLTARLVAFRSYPGEEGPVQRAVADWLREYGMAPEFQTIRGDRPNVIARVENGAGPTLLLNGHVDTVLAARGWSGDPWTARREGDRLYGLGAGDMKGGVAIAMVVTRVLARARNRWRGNVLFTSVVDEEAYSIGARALVDQRIHADACIVTEGSFDHPVLGGVGKVLVRGDVIGKSAHGSWPRDGINAAVEAAKLIARLDEMPLGQHPRLDPTQCVLSVHSGNDQYVITVPENARFTINRHIVPGETDESVLTEMRTLAASLQSPARFAFAVDPPYYPPYEIRVDHRVVQSFARAYQEERGQAPAFGYNQGVADTNYFAADLGIPTIQFGPRGGGWHQANEWVDVPSLATAARVILRLAEEILR